MRLTNATEKSIAILAMLITQTKEISLQSTIIAKRLELSDTYTKKLLRKLVVAKIVNSETGNNGGFKITKEWEQIDMLQVVEAIEGEISTYPNYGTIAHAFSEFPHSSKDGEQVIKNIFTDADNKYKDELKTKKLGEIFKQIFKNRHLEINWQNFNTKG